MRPGSVARRNEVAMLWIRHVLVQEYETGLLYENGRYIHTLGPGRHRLIDLPWLRQEITRVDMRRQPLLLSGQEMLTADAISVRLNLAAEYRVVDGEAALHRVANYVTALYTALQLLLRDEVQARTLDTLLGDRAALGGALLERGETEAASLGLELVTVGVRDVILPGDVKRMLSQEIEALRTGRAALVAAREEVAATRARANTAQLLEKSPILLRLREIESLEKIGEGHGNTVVLALPADLSKALSGR
jgi:regulator of protease activity HflC (stomatin/prohibitin superfamily)